MNMHLPFPSTTINTTIARFLRALNCFKQSYYVRFEEFPCCTNSSGQSSDITKCEFFFLENICKEEWRKLDIWPRKIDSSCWCRGKHPFHLSNEPQDSKWKCTNEKTICSTFRMKIMVSALIVLQLPYRMARDRDEYDVKGFHAWKLWQRHFGLWGAH